MDLSDPAPTAGAGPTAGPPTPNAPEPPGFPPGPRGPTAGFDGSDGPDGPGPQPLSWPVRILLVVAALFAVAAVAGFIIHLPYTTISPGEAVSLPPKVTVSGGHSYPDGRGDIRLLFVRESEHVNLWQWLQAHLDSNIELLKDEAVNPGKLSAEQVGELSDQQMADAKTSATLVALGAAGYKVKIAPGLTVSDLTPGMPAIDVLRWGDVLLEVDGRTIKSSDDLTAVIQKHKVGDVLPFVIERAGKRMDVSVRIGVFQDPPVKGHPGIGVELSPRFTFPVNVNVDTSGIGGPSAGLAMTLAIYDDLTPGDLTGGHRIAVTGTIDDNGNVGEIGGIQQKALSARSAKVSMFIVPQCGPNEASCEADLAGVRKRVGSSIKVVPVSTFAQALDALRAVGGLPAASPSSTTTTTIIG